MAKKNTVSSSTSKIRIVGYGCSYTGGDELLDHLIHPNADELKRKQGMTAWRTGWAPRRRLILDKLYRKQYALSWVAQLADLLELSWENRSYRGTSLAEHVYTIERDMATGRILSRDLILVGVTTPWRGCYFPDDSPKCHSFLFSMPDHWPRRNWHPETLLDFYTDRQLYLDHLLLQLRLAQLPRVYLVRMEDIPYHLVGGDPVVVSRQQQLCDSGRILGTESLFSLINGEDELHGGGHPKLIVHQRLAEHLEPLVRHMVSEL